MTLCPRSMNHRPADFSAKDCVFAGECGCEYGLAARNVGYSIGLREAAEIVAAYIGIEAGKQQVVGAGTIRRAINDRISSLSTSSEEK